MISQEYSLGVIITKEKNTCSCLYFYSFSLYKSVTRSIASSCETTVKLETSVNPITNTFMNFIKSDRGSAIMKKKKTN